ncbi:hypothetical protein ACFO3J_26680 [Streptomyces polygonati]|uniref:CHAT domain-containing protein n=1 Tax=Streptomyces polygonati TaxID=1617087 RepID=A0ABV8HSL0_9ACTN
MVELEELRRAAGGALGPAAGERLIADALAGAGVAAAAGVLPSEDLPDLRGLLAPRTGAYGARVPALLEWADPTALLRGDASWTARLASWWSAAAEDGPGARLSVKSPDDADDLASLLSALRAARNISAVSAAAAPTPGTCPPWTWPLRVILLPDASERERTALAERLRGTPLWQACVTEIAPTGRWARASLVVVREGDAEPASAVTATATVVAALRGAAGSAYPPGPGGLRRIAAGFGTTNAAAVDPGADEAEWLVALLAAMTEDLPLDTALDRAARAVGAAPAQLLADPGLLDGTRVRAAVARAAIGLGAGGRAGLERSLRSSETPHGMRPGDLSARRSARILREVHRDRRSQPYRVLRARLTEPGQQAATTAAVLPHTRYELRAWVGRPGRATAEQVLLPVDALPRRGTHQVRIVASELHGSEPDGPEHGGSEPRGPRPDGSEPRPQTSPRPVQLREVRLPADGPSEEAVFAVTTGAPGSAVSVRLTLLHRGRILQSGVLSATVGSTRPPSFELESVVHADTDDLEARVPHDLALTLDRDTSGTPVVTTVTDSVAVEIRSPVELARTVAELAAMLSCPARSPDEYEGYTSPSYEELLISLAKSGSALFRGLFGERTGLVPAVDAAALREARRVSVLAARPEELLPLELVYDRPLRIGGPLGEAGRLCPHAPSLPGAARCATDCPEHASPHVVCPFGFWGASKVIERHVSADRSARMAKDFVLAVGPDVERHTVGFGSLLAAACDRADHNGTRAWTAAVARLRTAFSPAFSTASTWRELAGQAQRLRDGSAPPDGLLLVVHSEKLTEDFHRGMALSIGSDDRLWIRDTLAPLVVAEAAANPLVLLIGCGTAEGLTPLLGAPSRFLDSGAPGVVATLAPVLSRHIIPVAVELVSEIRRLADAPGTGTLLGEALTSARAAALLRGEAWALALVGYGDTDWEVRAR